MIISTSAFGKASASGKFESMMKATTRFCSSTAVLKSSNGGSVSPRARDPAVQRELFLNVLNANATKRDAKQYLARFRPPTPQKDPGARLSPLQQEQNAVHRRDQDRLDRLGVNLGELYAPARAIADSPQFVRETVEEKASAALQREIHVALVCLRDAETLSDEILDGVAKTLSQLVELDMRVVLVLECNSGRASSDAVHAKRMKMSFTMQAHRLMRLIDEHNPRGSRLIEDAFENSADETSVVSARLVMEPLKRGAIPVVPTVAHTSSGQLVTASVTEVMKALTSLLSGNSNITQPKQSYPDSANLLDRVIVLDVAGGIPSKRRGGSAHVFINLEQEYDEIQSELAEIGSATAGNEENTSGAVSYRRHAANFTMLRECLHLLPSASSALIITPEEAASASQSSSRHEDTLGAGTRRQKNTLIHNLLTNKPSVSSSLPVARLRSIPDLSRPATSLSPPSATLLKRGMPVTIIPSIDTRTGAGWSRPPSGTTTLELSNDPRVDLPRLVHLIEDSFRRKINVHDYLTRIRTHTAGLIIAGDYEGAAILTWEPSPVDPTRVVPYLDKFAVLSSSQGSSGVADIVFQSMVRTCFPEGVCWRSRKDNPVNKWYFERSAGTWQIPGTNWTMFWTGEGVVENVMRWKDYVSVCREVKPSWADMNRRPD